MSIPDEDVAVLDRYVREAGLPSRSAGVQQALRRLRRASLQQDYADASAEWEGPGEANVWDAVTVTVTASMARWLSSGCRDRQTWSTVLRGEVRVVDLEPSRGIQAGKSRPGVVVSNDDANETAAHLGRGTVTITPLTTSTARVMSFQVLLPAEEAGLRQDWKAQAEQVRAVALERIGPPLGRVGHAAMARIDDALRLHLDL